MGVSRSEWRRAKARNISFETLYGGQFTLSIQLIILNCPAAITVGSTECDGDLIRQRLLLFELTINIVKGCMVYLWFWSYWFSCGACGVRLAVLEQHNSLGFSSLTKRLHGQTLYTTLDTQCRLSILMCHGFIGVLLKWNKWNATGDENG